MKTALCFFDQIGCIQYFLPFPLVLPASQVSLRQGLNSHSSLGNILDVNLDNC